MDIADFVKSVDSRGKQCAQFSVAWSELLCDLTAQFDIDVPPVFLDAVETVHDKDKHLFFHARPCVIVHAILQMIGGHSSMATMSLPDTDATIPSSLLGT